MSPWLLTWLANYKIAFRSFFTRILTFWNRKYKFPLGDTNFIFSCWKYLSLIRFAHSWEILSAREDKIRIPTRPGNILYLCNSSKHIFFEHCALAGLNGNFIIQMISWIRCLILKTIGRSLWRHIWHDHILTATISQIPSSSNILSNNKSCVFIRFSGKHFTSQ